MTVHTERVGCKVNLGLRITGIRPDGYHELDSLFLPLHEPCDMLEFMPVSKAPAEAGMVVECATPGIDLARNTLTKAYDAYKACAAATGRTGMPKAVRVRLHKGIPHGAGLGGGSADAAAVLRWCNAQAAQPLSLSELEAVALKVGADVPFFLHNVPARVQGIGERITPCPSPWRGWHLLLLCPEVRVSTPWAYAAWDKARAEKKFTHSLECRLTSEGLEAKEESSCATWLFNDFEAVVFSAHPELRKLKEKALQAGAAAVVMSGSGASLAALFRHSEKAHTAAQQLSQDAKGFVSAL